RPGDGRPLVVGQVVVEAGVAFHRCAPAAAARAGTWRSCASVSSTEITSAYFSAMSYRLAKCGLSCLSATHSSGTMVRKLRCRLSSTVARTQPEVEPPVTTTVSTPWKVKIEPRLVSKKAEA